MACTVAVEEVIEEHYKEQENILKKDNTEKELIKIIKKFRKFKMGWTSFSPCCY